MLKEFRAFILRGNVVDLAVGVVIGAAFGAIVKSLVDNVISPLIALINLPDFSTAVVEIGGTTDPDFKYGLVINALISFLVIAAVIFFFVVKPVNHLMAREKGDEELPPETKDCPHCLSTIPAGATVCMACTRDVVETRRRPAKR